MKINQDMMSQLDTGTKHPNRSGEAQSSFRQLVRSSSAEVKQQEIAQLVKNITVQGDKVARFRSLKDLAKFKVMVKQFLKDTVGQALELKQDHHFSKHGNSQKLAVVRQVNERLVSLTKDLMNQEKKTVDLLDAIGEIKGLLINLAV